MSRIAEAAKAIHALINELATYLTPPLLRSACDMTKERSVVGSWAKRMEPFATALNVTLQSK